MNSTGGVMDEQIRARGLTLNMASYRQRAAWNFFATKYSLSDGLETRFAAWPSKFLAPVAPPLLDKPAAPEEQEPWHCR